MDDGKNAQGNVHSITRVEIRVEMGYFSSVSKIMLVIVDIVIEYY
jgi:hypothetical protein